MDVYLVRAITILLLNTISCSLVLSLFTQMEISWLHHANTILFLSVMTPDIAK